MTRKFGAALPLFLCLVGPLMAPTPAVAKRVAPAEVTPVTADGVTYSATHECMGCVQATDDTTKARLWWRQIYTVRFDPKLEQDVQSVYIKTLEKNGSVLVITSEAGVYELDLKTLAVTAIKGSTVLP